MTSPKTDARQCEAPMNHVDSAGRYMRRGFDASRTPPVFARKLASREAQRLPSEMVGRLLPGQSARQAKLART